MSTKNILLSNNRLELKKNSFYNFCGQELESLEELLSDPSLKSEFDVNLLSVGLLGALENNKENNISILSAYILKNDILIKASPNNKDPYLVKSMERTNTKSLQIMFNAATTFENLTLAKYLTQKYLILEKALNHDLGEDISLKTGAHEDSASITEDGSLSFFRMRGGPVPQLTIKEHKYGLNPILFNLKNFNPKLLESFLASENPIHPSIIKHGIVINTYLNNSESNLYLFSNKKCLDIIKSSEKIQAFINSDADFPEQKMAIRSALLMFDLTDELTANNQNQTKQPKI